jgi:polyisoprenoid-binding protein YceI
LHLKKTLMSSFRRKFLIVILVVASFGGYIAGCTHDDELLTSQGPNIERGTEKISLANTNTSFDKAHSNVQWSSAYLGSVSLLTGRFDNFGFDSFNFDEPNADGISFSAWVWLNTVNTSEPARDDGCLLQTFGTEGSFTTEPANLAIIKSKKVELSTTDTGYNVTADLTFHGVTKEVTCKMNYDGKTVSGANDVYGFSLQFQFLAQTDFLIVSTNVGDKADVKCNAVFKVAP